MIRWLLILLGIVALTLFVLANPEARGVRLWPGGLVLEGAAWQVLLGAAAIGFGLGAVVVWIAHVPEKRRLARLQRSSSLLKAELDERRLGGAAPVPARQPARGTAVTVR